MLHSKKQTLLLESELNRQIMRLEVGQLEGRADKWKRGLDAFGGAWKWAAPVAGFFLARKFRGASGLLAKSSVGLAVLRAVWQWLGPKR